MNHPPLTDEQVALQISDHLNKVMHQMFGVPQRPMVLPYGDGTANPTMDDDEGELA